MKSLSRLYKAYHDFLTKRPVLVQSVQTAILCGTGDIIAQTVIEKKKLKEFDFRRFAVFSGFGGIVVGPTLRLWYGILDKKVTGSDYVALTKKVLLDQCVVAPFFLLVTLIAINAGTGKSLEEIKEKLDAEYLNILITNYKVWPAVQFINFGFVPVNYQVPIAQIVGVFWNSYLSWRANEALPPHKSAAN